jgi:hypothetical protein
MPRMRPSAHPEAWTHLVQECLAWDQTRADSVEETFYVAVLVKPFYRLPFVAESLT